MNERQTPIYETEKDSDLPDPDATPIKDRKVVTQPYDLSIDAIVGQVNSKILFLRPLSERPKFQRQYVWSDKLASRLVESVLLNVPIPPCYLSENEICELDVIDGQQRIYSLYRFIENQFRLTDLQALSEYNKLRFFELPTREQRKFKTHTLRCVVVTNESHPEIKFDVFERLNTNTVPLNAQELRNCIYRGVLNDLLAELSFDDRWLSIRSRKLPDKRLADEEMILRFFAFQLLGLDSYKTPLKTWLNDAAKFGQRLDAEQIQSLRTKWSHCLDVVLTLFEANNAFRRPGSKSINRALFDLTMATAASITLKTAEKQHGRFHKAYQELTEETGEMEEGEGFQDLISRAVDHRKRTINRFRIWNEAMFDVFR